MTLRDQVWHEALWKVHEEGKFKISDLTFEQSERHTVRRVLKRMEELGWLERDTEGSPIWRLGPTGEQLLSVDDDLKEAAHA